ncbi:hypothetical protein ACFLX7_04465 [Chloroflexota bacterium]
MKKTWKPTVAGILNIVTGSLELTGSILFVVIYLCYTSSNQFIPGLEACPAAWVAPTVIIIVTVFMIIVGVLSLIGGIYAVQRRKWGLALTGSIAAIFGSQLFGMLATIFTAMSRDEFEQ